MAERCDTLVELAKNDVGAIAAQYVWLRCACQFARLVRITKYDLPGLEWALQTIAAADWAPVDSWLTDSVFESERLVSIWQDAGILAVDHGDARDRWVCLFNPLE